MKPTEVQEVIQLILRKEVGNATTQAVEILNRIEMNRQHEALALAHSLEQSAQFICHLLSRQINSE